MSIASTDAPEEASTGDFAPASPELAESPAAAPVMPLSPEDVARDNARGGRWAMNEFYDGCVLLGADDKPVMRNDGSRVGFFFRDAERLAAELADGPASGGLPSADETDSRAAAWRAHRRALAPLDSGYNKDWDPQRPKSTLADMTKWTRLLAYYYVQTTEPEEAVRHAVSDIFGKPLNGPRMRLWVPGKHNAETVKAVADGLMRQAAGDEKAAQASTFGAMPRASKVVLADDGNSGVALATALIDRADDSPAAESQVVQVDDTTGDKGDASYSNVVHSSDNLPLPPPRKPPLPPEPERDPPRPNRDGVERQWQRTPPQQQPMDVKEALAKSHLKDIWREVLRRKFETSGRPDEGYGTYLFADKGYAYGAYQFRRPALEQIGVRSADGRWTGKFGVRGWRDFLNSAEAQEAALVEWTQYNEEAVDRYHLGRLGKEISTAEGKIIVTRSGLVGAMHMWGRTGVRDYMQWIEKNNWVSPAQKPQRFMDIEKRLRGFEHVPY